ncbi:MAG: hypothetical protein ACJAYU_000622 [Bradymonadia bacterium]|jgi:hypothetical protein
MRLMLLPALALAACNSDSNDTSSTDAGADLVEDSVADTSDGSGEGDVVTDAPDVIEADDRLDGEDCVADQQCASGECLLPEEGFPGGMCSVTGCEGRSDCFSVGAACLRGEFNGNLCVQLCASDAECREGYRCAGENGGSYCFPDIVGAALNPVCDSRLLAESDIRSPFQTGAGSLNRHEIIFEISEEATAFSVVAWDLRNRVYTERIRFPDGQELRIDEYASYFFSPGTFETVSPVLFPGGPQYVPDMQGGEYAMEIGYSGREVDDICFVVFEETAGLSPDDEPLVVDMNFYFVGAPGLDAVSAPTDSDFQEMLEQFDLAYDQAGVELGELRYYDVIGAVEDRFQLIRDPDEVFELVQLSRQPGPTRDDLLRVNVFFNEGFAGEMGGVLGVSAGIPGAMGLHSAEATGLVFSASNLGGRGNAQVGQTLAHELGHFLGLFHTTEQRGGGSDQLEDTPVCEAISEGLGACPDLQNLMFPVAAWSGTAQVSIGQSVIIRANPLTKQRDVQ